MAIYQLADHQPHIDPSSFIADTAAVIGKVTLAQGCSIWFSAVLRGDNELIAIGRASNVQEGAVLHTDPGCPLTVGENVTIGHQAMLHGCTIGDGSLIGMQAIVLNRAVIGKNCLIGAGALVTEGKIIPDNSLVVGSPGKVLRPLTEAEIATMHRNTAGYVKKAALFSSDLKRIQP
ncbi:gamma carbonic anhydrase family protein [Parvibium lacunae]|uniref:Gamma carbonic anhydrase family protein n=1 Tax=Parvibium lacunae TaxID=1888893 RepID=A0A368L710_9BURK|nr:gamma carbonic anhydrase family protein [Parvibium lacunae]RCS59450.1 gamma carbonic anhydrase family protein [Parvibium lacunae]